MPTDTTRLARQLAKLALKDPALRNHLKEKVANDERSARFPKGKPVDVPAYLRKHDNEEAAEEWEKYEGEVEDLKGKKKLAKILAKIALEHPEYRQKVAKMLMAEKWENLPKGWTDESRKKFWDSLTSRAPKHKVSECIKKMEGKPGITDAGAFCAALADRVVGKKWREEANKKKAADEGMTWLSLDEVRELCPPCAEKMAARGIRRLQASQDLVDKIKKKSA